MHYYYFKISRHGLNFKIWQRSKHTSILLLHFLSFLYLQFAHFYTMEDEATCFLCQTKTSIENVCPHCTGAQNIYYCSKSHFEAHRGIIRADENTAKVCVNS